MVVSDWSVVGEQAEGEGGVPQWSRYSRSRATGPHLLRKVTASPWDRVDMDTSFTWKYISFYCDYCTLGCKMKGFFQFF